MHIVSTTDLMGPDWGFLRADSNDPDLTWSTHSGVPRAGIEQRIGRPHLGRYRAGFQATTEAASRKDALLVGHLPLMSAATNLFRRRRCPDVPMIGFSFNFTKLPTGVSRKYLIHALRGIDEFVVYSRFEQKNYPAYFDLEPARVRFLPWAMAPPEPGPVNPTGLTEPYLCAIGGEGRDYALLANVMRTLPAVKMVVIARSYSIVGIDFPDNVQVFTNLPLGQTWRVAQDSGGLVIPLISPRTACGHITLVGAQLLEIPLVITRSQGVNDYANDRNARLVHVGDSGDLRAAVTQLADDPEGAKSRAAAGLAQARVENSPAAWLDYFQTKKQSL
ncbi:hypothetical protein [Roseobacter litoralis]|uniref:hypothetical protein n=1 Tax=Roseobacter litoralis TaxID=42443 RepID=UPI0024918DD2|nr:hypothetical protein [Roseobacter litoralis]